MADAGSKKRRKGDPPAVPLAPPTAVVAEVSICLRLAVGAALSVTMRPDTLAARGALPGPFGRRVLVGAPESSSGRVQGKDEEGEEEGAPRRGVRFAAADEDGSLAEAGPDSQAGPGPAWKWASSDDKAVGGVGHDAGHAARAAAMLTEAAEAARATAAGALRQRVRDARNRRRARRGLQPVEDEVKDSGSEGGGEGQGESKEEDRELEATGGAAGTTDGTGLGSGGFAAPSSGGGGGSMDLGGFAATTSGGGVGPQLAAREWIVAQEVRGDAWLGNAGAQIALEARPTAPLPADAAKSAGLELTLGWPEEDPSGADAMAQEAEFIGVGGAQQQQQLLGTMESGASLGMSAS